MGANALSISVRRSPSPNDAIDLPAPLEAIAARRGEQQRRALGRRAYTEKRKALSRRLGDHLAALDDKTPGTRVTIASSRRVAVGEAALRGCRDRAFAAAVSSRPPRRADVPPPTHRAHAARAHGTATSTCRRTPRRPESFSDRSQMHVSRTLRDALTRRREAADEANVVFG